MPLVLPQTSRQFVGSATLVTGLQQRSNSIIGNRLVLDSSRPAAPLFPSSVSSIVPPLYLSIESYIHVY